jgi:hypothetical protein
VVGDGDAVGIAAEVGIDMLGAVERFFGVGDPFLTPEFFEETMKGWFFLQVLRVPPEQEFSLVEGFFEGIEELPSHNQREGFDGDEEGVFCGDPVLGGGVESPAGDDEMEVGVEKEVLIPGVQDGGKA